jgi:transcriptional regulator with XRE-family HTH domain
MAYSTVSLEEMLAAESEEFRQSVEQRTAELIAEEMNLREMRRLRKITQARLSKKLKIGQEGVSRIEKRTDLYLSTLRSYVEGLGGKLSLTVEFPDRAPVVLSGLGEEKVVKKVRRKLAVDPKRAAGSKTRRHLAA